MESEQLTENKILQMDKIIPKKKNKSKSQTQLTPEDLINIFKAAKQNQEGMTVQSQLLTTNIKALSYKQCKQLEGKLREAIKNYYLRLRDFVEDGSQEKNQIGNNNQNEIKENEQDNTQGEQMVKSQSIEQQAGDINNKQQQHQNQDIKKQAIIFVQDFHQLLKALKQYQFPAPVSDRFFSMFISITKRCLQQKILQKSQIFPIWKDIPTRNFPDFLSQLQLKQMYNNQPPQKMIHFLNTQYLLINKISHCCTYYSYYNPHQTNSNNNQIYQFENQHLAPKISTSDQLLSPQVVKLLAKKQKLKQLIIESIDISKVIILLEQLNQDPRVYKNVNQFILRKHYLAMKRQYKNWYIFQDKMGFNPMFIQMYCKEIQMKKQNGQKGENQDEEQIKKQGQIIEEVTEQIIRSIRIRNNDKRVKQEENINNKNQQQRKGIIPNPLYLYDEFTATDNIIKLHQQLYLGLTDSKKIQNKANYYLLKDSNFTEQMVHFIDEPNSNQFKLMSDDILLHSQKVGFDAQNRCTSTKYQQQGVSLIQLKTQKAIYILDYMKMENQSIFLDFFQKFLSNQNILKLGHTVNSDIRLLEKTTKIQKCEGFVDIAVMFKNRFPHQTQSSLAFMTEKLTGKKLSKYQQRSNWNRRPLKRSQMHYAALDALICDVIYDILNDKEFKVHGNAGTKIKPQRKENEGIVRLQNIAYSKKFQTVLQQKYPKFLVDNMLKKLCSIMRNLGIDTQYSAVNNFQLLKNIAQKQGRIIITRDTKLIKKSKITAPLYCIQQKSDSDLMFAEIKNYFKLDLSQFTTLSRCVKCNCSDIEVITKQQAMKNLAFHHNDTLIQQFWRCIKCKQIYWEGNQFKNAKDKFENMK